MLHHRSQESSENRRRIRFLEEENSKQAKEVWLLLIIPRFRLVLLYANEYGLTYLQIRRFKDYISELILHAEAQASQYQQRVKSLEGSSACSSDCFWECIIGKVRDIERKSDWSIVSGE